MIHPGDCLDILPTQTTFTRGLRSSASQEWETPRDLFDALDREFHFTLDVCATPQNAKCKRYFTVEDDGLSQSWAGETCWMNPPYGRVIGHWMRKALSEYKGGATVVCLVRSRTDAKWWWDTAMQVWPHGIRFIRGRVRFSGSSCSAPFPSAIIVFGGETRIAPAKAQELLPETV